MILLLAVLLLQAQAAGCDRLASPAVPDDRAAVVAQHGHDEDTLCGQAFGAVAAAAKRVLSRGAWLPALMGLIGVLTLGIGHIVRPVTRRRIQSSAPTRSRDSGRLLLVSLGIARI